jgi:hypothetical protein
MAHLPMAWVSGTNIALENSFFHMKKLKWTKFISYPNKDNYNNKSSKILKSQRTQVCFMRI